MAASLRRRSTLLALSLAGLGAFLFPLHPEAATSSGSELKCARWAAPHGSNSNPGTAKQPVRTADVLVRRLKPGQRGCFRAGIYQFDSLSLREPQTKISSAPGESATLLGHIRVERSAKGATIENLVLNGRNAANLAGPLVYANQARIQNNNISNNHMASCVFVDSYGDAPPPSGVVIKDNKIHDCGRLPNTNQDHGIYLDNSRRATVRGNWIWDNADRGVQMYPDAQRSVIVRNVIDSNGQGVIFGGNNRASSKNVVRQNVISNSNVRFNVESSWAGPVGKRNLVRDNCVWASTNGEYNGSPRNSGIPRHRKGFKVSRLTVAEPAFVNRLGKDFRLVPDSPCARNVGWTDAGASSAGSAP
jgi:hypothetical protein